VSGRSESWITTGFHPMALQRRRKIVSLTFERRREMVAAGNREAVRSGLDNVEGDLQCLPNDLDSS
jgi:hypothetical protein